MLSSPIFYGGIYLEVFRERKMDWPTSISVVSVGRDSYRSAKGGYPDITISSFDVFYKNCGFYFLDGD